MGSDSGLSQWDQQKEAAIGIGPVGTSTGIIHWDQPLGPGTDGNGLSHWDQQLGSPHWEHAMGSAIGISQCDQQMGSAIGISPLGSSNGIIHWDQPLVSGTEGNGISHWDQQKGSPIGISHWDHQLGGISTWDQLMGSAIGISLLGTSNVTSQWEQPLGSGTDGKWDQPLGTSKLDQHLGSAFWEPAIAISTKSMNIIILGVGQPFPLNL